MLYREIIAACSEINTSTEHVNTLCEQNVELLNGKPLGASRDQYALEC